METIFTYGSLMCADIMSAVTGLTVVGVSATLHGYRRYAVVGEHYPGAVVENDRSVEGVLYTGLSSAALNRLDAFEGDCYLRKPVTVVSEGGRLIEAQCYVWHDAFIAQLAPWDWSFSHFLSRGKDEFLARYIGFARD